MTLADGLQKYEGEPDSDYKWTQELELKGQEILNLLNRCGDKPGEDELDKAKKFLIEVEKWKAMCDRTRTGNAKKNSNTDVWSALLGAVRAKSDEKALLAIMELKGFGSSLDEETQQRRAKVATAVLRFLWPEKWGVVDWRTAAMLGLLEKHKWNVDRALSEAKTRSAEDLRGSLDLINEKAACELNEKYRVVSRKYPDDLPRAADVDMALFGLSLEAWPMRS